MQAKLLFETSPYVGPDSSLLGRQAGAKLLAKAAAVTRAELLRSGNFDTLGLVLDEYGSRAAGWLRHAFPFLRGFDEPILADACYRLWLRRLDIDPKTASLWRSFCEMVRDAACEFLRGQVARQRRTAWCVDLDARGSPLSSVGVLAGATLSPGELAQVPMVRDLIYRLPPRERELVLSPLLSIDDSWPAVIAEEFGGDANYVRVKRRRLIRRILQTACDGTSASQNGADDVAQLVRPGVTELRGDVDDRLLAAWMSSPPDLPADVGGEPAVDAPTVPLSDACRADILADAVARIRAHQRFCGPRRAKSQRQVLVGPLANASGRKQRAEFIEALEKAGDYVVAIESLGLKELRRLPLGLSRCDGILWPVLSRYSEFAVALAEYVAERFERDGGPVVVPLTDDMSDLPYPLNHYLPAECILKIADLPLDEFVRTLSQTFSYDDAAESTATVWPVPRTDPQAYRASGTGTQVPWYVRRPIDNELAELAGRFGETTTVYGPRQSGKSSALRRYLDTCRHQAGKSIVVIDFATARPSVLESFWQLANWIAGQLRRQLWVADRFLTRTPESASELGDFLEDAVLAGGSPRLVLAFDQADRLLGHACQQEFFAMLRAWHDRRRRPGSLWKEVDLVIVVSTDPFLLIDSPTISPFNVSRVISIEPFSTDESRILNGLYGTPVANGHVQQLHELVGGHPYLTQLAHAWLLAEGARHFDQLFQTAADDDGPFADHLQALLFRLVSELGVPAERALRDLVRRGQGGDREAITRLQSAGLVRVDREGRASLANPVYTQFLGRVL